MRRHLSLEHLYQAIGLNTGNLLFTHAVWSQLDGDKEHVGFNFDPKAVSERLDALVIPAANWVNPRTDLGDLADRIENLRIPAIIIGLGAQIEDENSEFTIPDGTLRLLRAVAERSASMSVRGEITKRILEKLGFSKIVVTGCPSLYYAFRPHKSAEREEFRLDRCIVHATRFYARDARFARTWSADRQLYRFAYHNNLDFAYQSEFEELAGC